MLVGENTNQRQITLNQWSGLLPVVGVFTNHLLVMLANLVMSLTDTYELNETGWSFITHYEDHL
jgi:hypothetical protein